MKKEKMYRVLLEINNKDSKQIERLFVQAINLQTAIFKVETELKGKNFDFISICEEAGKVL